MKNEECTCDVRSVPYAVLELEDRKHKRLWVVILVLIVALLGTNAGWIYRESQFVDEETTSITQDVDTGNGDATVTGIGDIYGTSETNSNDN